MKKILFLVLILATFIAIFCLSSSALEYGQQFLDPDYYEDDIALVFGLYYDASYWGEGDDVIFIPLYQIRIPDYSGGQFYGYIEPGTYDTNLEDIVISFELYEGSYVSEFNSTSVDLSDFLLYNLDSYPIHSDFWDDPLLFIIDSFGLNIVDFSSGESFISSNQTMFYGLWCDYWEQSIPLPNPSTLEIPTYPARPLPDPEDPPLPPTGSIRAILRNMFTYPIDLFEDITISTGTLTLFLSAVGFVFFVRFILMPVFGVMPAGVSDSVKAGRSELKERRSERRMLRRADRNYRRSRR